MPELTTTDLTQKLLEIAAQHPTNPWQLSKSEWEGTLKPDESVWNAILGELLDLAAKGEQLPPETVGELYWTAPKLRTETLMKLAHCRSIHELLTKCVQPREVPGIICGSCQRPAVARNRSEWTEMTHRVGPWRCRGCSSPRSKPPKSKMSTQNVPARELTQLEFDALAWLQRTSDSVMGPMLTSFLHQALAWERQAVHRYDAPLSPKQFRVLTERYRTYLASEEYLTTLRTRETPSLN